MDPNARNFEAELEELLFEDDKIKEYTDPLAQRIVL
jgi:hypothetical protein